MGKWKDGGRGMTELELELKVDVWARGDGGEDVVRLEYYLTCSDVYC